MVSIGSLTTIADDITIDTPSKVLTRMNELGAPVAETLIPDVVTGSMTLQLPALTSAAPALGATFSLKDTGGTTGNYKVSKNSQVFASDKETKIKVDFRQRFATGS